MDTAAKTLCPLNDIGVRQMGVTMDYGHSKHGQENPAEVLTLLANSRYPYYIHINDNNAKWDWDFMGTKYSPWGMGRCFGLGEIRPDTGRGGVMW